MDALSSLTTSRSLSNTTMRFSCMGTRRSESVWAGVRLQREARSSSSNWLPERSKQRRGQPMRNNKGEYLFVLLYQALFGPPEFFAI